MKQIALRFFLLVSLVFPAHGQTTNGDKANGDQFSGVREFIRKQMIERNVPSVAVAAASNSQVRTRHGIWHRLEHGCLSRESPGGSAWRRNVTQWVELKKQWIDAH